MIIFTLRRILLLLITLFFLTLVSFSLSYFTPRAPLNGAALLDAYQFYFVSLLHWDFGVSSINGQAISEQLREVFPATMELCLLAFALALFIGIPLGIIAGVLRGKWQDTAISTFALLGFSMPVFWLALLLMLFFSLHTGWLPVSGRFDLLYQVKPITGFALIDAAVGLAVPRRDDRQRPAPHDPADRRAGGGAHHRSGAPDAHQHRRRAEPKLHQGRRHPRPVALHHHSPPRVAQCAAADRAQTGAAVLHHAHAGDDH